jgi:hypothetical protein
LRRKVASCSDLPAVGLAHVDRVKGPFQRIRPPHRPCQSKNMPALCDVDSLRSIPLPALPSGPTGGRRTPSRLQPPPEPRTCVGHVRLGDPVIYCRLDCDLFIEAVAPKCRHRSTPRRRRGLVIPERPALRWPRAAGSWAGSLRRAGAVGPDLARWGVGVEVGTGLSPRARRQLNPGLFGSQSPASNRCRSLVAPIPRMRGIGARERSRTNKGRVNPSNHSPPVLIGTKKRNRSWHL